jgi:hypothetical protein
MRSYLEIARQALRQVKVPDDAAYSELTCRAMRRIAEVCPPGALTWAREVHPALAKKIDAELLTRLNELWGNHAPLPEFQAALDDLVRVHSDIGRLFAAEAQPGR